MDVHRYERLKSELADLLRSIPWRAEQFERNRGIYARLAEDRFNLAVVGRFSRGKSTLMNAMLGMDRLPTGVEPLTSVITSVTYASRERVVLHFQHTSLPQDIRIDELDDYVTERGNPGNRRRVGEAEIQLPASLLRSGFRFIDTPGLGSPVADNTATTQAFLPEADAFVLVTGFDGPLTDDEANILHMGRRAGKRIFVVVNKADRVDDERRAMLLAALQHRLRDAGIDAAPRLYPVSATEALQARTGHLPSSRLAASGVPMLEADIVAFLTGEKRHTLLRGICTRLGEVLASEPALGWAHERLAELRGLIDASPTNDAGSEETHGGEAVLPANIPGCPACIDAEAAVFDALTGLQADLTRREACRREFAQVGGLCGIHSRAFMSHAAPREICIGFAPVLDMRAKRLRSAAVEIERDPNGAVASHEPPRCSLCQVAQAAGERALHTVGEAIRSAADWGAIPQPGFCLPHLDRLAAALATHPRLPQLLRRQASILERRSDDMMRFALKQDASMTDGISDEERMAARRGVNALVGQADTTDPGPA